jgi:hypothetical protein
MTLDAVRGTTYLASSPQSAPGNDEERDATSAMFEALLGRIVEFVARGATADRHASAAARTDARAEAAPATRQAKVGEHPRSERKADTQVEAALAEATTDTRSVHARATGHGTSSPRRASSAPPARTIHARSRQALDTQTAPAGAPSLSDATRAVASAVEPPARSIHATIVTAPPAHTGLAAPPAHVERTPQGERAALSVQHPELGVVELEVLCRNGRVEVHALLASPHAAAVLRANESEVRRGVQASGLVFRGLKLRVREANHAPRAVLARSRHEDEGES